MKDRYNLDGPFRMGSLERCELMRNGRGPFAFHCRWCDKKIAETKREQAVYDPELRQK